MSTGSSRAAWGITCRRKHLKSSPQPSSPSPSKADRHLHPLKEHTMSTLEGESDGLPAGKLLYTAKVHTTGGRERGVARSCDGNLDIRLSTPGAGGSGSNPEQPLAAGWPACSEGAITRDARQNRTPMPRPD